MIASVTAWWIHCGWQSVPSCGSIESAAVFYWVLAWNSTQPFWALTFAVAVLTIQTSLHQLPSVLASSSAGTSSSWWRFSSGRDTSACSYCPVQTISSAERLSCCRRFRIRTWTLTKPSASGPRWSWEFPWQPSWAVPTCSVSSGREASSNGWNPFWHPQSYFGTLLGKTVFWFSIRSATLQFVGMPVACWVGSGSIQASQRNPLTCSPKPSLHTSVAILEISLGGCTSWTCWTSPGRSSGRISFWS